MDEEGTYKASDRIKRSDAVKFNHHLIQKWKPASEVWPFTYGDDVAGAMSAASSCYITYFFRKQLKMRAFARLTCYTPVVGLAAIGTHVFHSQAMTADILNSEACPLCLTTKASIIQMAFGVGYPLITAPITTFYLADRLLTYPIPPLVRSPKEVFNLWFKLVQKIPRPLFIFAALHAIGGTFITYQKQKTLIEIKGLPR